MLIPRTNVRLGLSGLGDEQSDLQAQLATVQAQQAQAQNEITRLQNAINAAATANVQPMPPRPPDANVASAGILGSILTTGADGKTKIFGLDWYLPVGGLAALFLLKRKK